MSQAKKAAKKAAVTKSSAKAVASKPNEGKPKKVAQKPSTKKAKTTLEKSIEAVDKLIYPEKAGVKTTVKKKTGKKPAMPKVVGTFTTEHKVWAKKDEAEKPVYGRPYVIYVVNKGDTNLKFTLGGAGLNRGKDNFGNPSGIEITYGLTGYTYAQFLADTEARPFKVGMVRIEVKKGSAANLISPLSVAQTSSEGTIYSRPLTPYPEKEGAMEAETAMDFDFDGDTTIQGELSAGAVVCYYLHPAARVVVPTVEAKPEFEIKPKPFVKPEATTEVTLEDRYDEAKKKAQGIDGQQREISRPYILEIRNNSQTKIEGFRINNIKQALQQGKEYDDRVSVNYGLHGYTYQAFLSHFVTHPTKFGRIRYEAFHGYERYRSQQLNACPLYIVESEPNGDTKTKAEIMSTALNQFYNGAVEMPCNFDLVGMGWDIRLDLLPDVMVRIHLFPAVVMDFWKQEKEALSPPQIGGVAPVKFIQDERVEALEAEVKRLEKVLAEKEVKNIPPDVAEKIAATATASDAAFPKDKK